MAAGPHLELPTITLLIFNPAHAADLSARIVNWLCERIRFGDCVHLSADKPSLPVAGRQVYVPRCDWQEGQRWQAYELHRYFHTPHMLHIETDGFPVHFDRWEQGFLAYDYIGAPWPPRLVPEGGDRVGNGGCSLQSARFRRLLWENRHLYTGEPSDVWFTRNTRLREVLDREGMRIADIGTAIRFSFENEMPEFPDWRHEQSFAFHGKSEWCQQAVARVN